MRRHLPGQHIFPGDSPGAKRREYGQDYGELFRQDRHRKGDPRKEPFNPVTPAHAVYDNNNRAQENAYDGDRPHNPRNFTLKPGLILLNRLKHGADLPHFGPGAS